MGREKHQTKTKSGTLAHIRINNVLHQQHFKHGTNPLVIRQWVLQQEMRYRRPGAMRTGKFDDDARAYLAAVAAMPTYAQRKQHIDAWIEAFGSMPRDRVTADLIRAQLSTWRKTLAPASVNKRRTALMHLFSTLDGKAAPNPVKDAPRFGEPTPAPRALPYPALKALFAAMPDSKSKARCMVIAFTGIPPGSLMAITEADVDIRGKVVAVPGRRKGAGTKGRIVPLTPDGVRAFKMMIRMEAFGRFPSAPIGRSLKRALKSAGLPSWVRVYDLRHTFGTEVYRRSGDIRATQLLMDHTTPTLTHRYTLAAQDPRVAAAVATFERKRR